MSFILGIPMPTSHDVNYNERSWSQYAAAVEACGGEALLLPLGLRTEELGAMADRCSGFVLPGSPADVDPALFGEECQPATAKADPERQATDSLLLQHAAVQGKPVLAICFGAQMLNVWCGGSLVQDLPPFPVNHEAGSAVAVAHSIQVDSESLLAGLLTATEAPARDGFRRLPINSSHHQAIDRVGESLAVVARSTEDQVIEAVEGRIGRAAMLGVQWHPERSYTLSAASRSLFRWLLAEAEDTQHMLLDAGTGHAL